MAQIDLIHCTGFTVFSSAYEIDLFLLKRKIEPFNSSAKIQTSYLSFVRGHSIIRKNLYVIIHTSIKVKE